MKFLFLFCLFFGEIKEICAPAAFRLAGVTAGEAAACQGAGSREQSTESVNQDELFGSQLYAQRVAKPDDADERRYDVASCVR